MSKRAINEISRPAVAVLATGGTIASLSDALDTLDYPDHGCTMMDATSVTKLLPPEAHALFDVRPIPFSAVVSTRIGPTEWHGIAKRIEGALKAEPDICGVIVTHGTASLEDTAFCLSLVWKHEQPIILVGAQRPSSAVSADGAANLLAAVRVAAAPEARGLGVLVVLNDEIHHARDVTKTSTYRLQTFQSPELGPLGVVDGDGPHLFRRLITAPSPFVADDLVGAPRVECSYGAYAGADGTAVEAFVAAGAKGIVSVAFPPGLLPPAELAALQSARARGVVVVQACRAAGRVAPRRFLREAGIVASCSLIPGKARIALMLALAKGMTVEAIQELFATL